MATIPKGRVLFSENVASEVPEDPGQSYSEPESEDSNSDTNDFQEVTSSEASEAESLNTSDEEDAECLKMFLEGTYSCSPSLFRSSVGLDPAERSSLLLLDKDIGDSEEECEQSARVENTFRSYFSDNDSSAVSELSGCGSEGCGTTTETPEDSSDEQQPHKCQKRGPG